MGFGYQTGVADFDLLTKSIVKQVGPTNVESVLIMDSGHMDQMDAVFYMSWIFALQNTMFKNSFEK